MSPRWSNWPSTTTNPPDEIGEEELRQYLLYLQNEKAVSASTMTVALCGIKFLYQHTLQREWRLLDLARAKQEKSLPAVLSVEEVARVLGCVHHPRYRACLTTIYACGLRIQRRRVPAGWRHRRQPPHAACAQGQRRPRSLCALAPDHPGDCCALTGAPIAIRCGCFRPDPLRANRSRPSPCR